MSSCFPRALLSHFFLYAIDMRRSLFTCSFHSCILLTTSSEITAIHHHVMAGEESTAAGLEWDDESPFCDTSRPMVPSVPRSQVVHGTHRDAAVSNRIIIVLRGCVVIVVSRRNIRGPILVVVDQQDPRQFVIIGSLSLRALLSLTKQCRHAWYC